MIEITSNDRKERFYFLAELFKINYYSIRIILDNSKNIQTTYFLINNYFKDLSEILQEQDCTNK